MRAIVSTWQSTALLDGTTVVRRQAAPTDPAELTARVRLRAAGRTTPEEDALLAGRGSEVWATRDRRLVGPNVRLVPDAPAAADRGGDRELHRQALLAAADEALAASWDPSIHVEEAVRAVRDLDRASNLLGERLTSWVGRDALDVEPTDPARAARAALDGTGSATLGPDDPRLRDARRRLAELYGQIRATREALEAAVAGAVPEHTPNLNDLLGPELTALMLAQAGGLDRLARMPSSTVQVLGAERAFFEHLRGRAPPPRHGLLFLHPKIQSAPRGDRGKLARALAGKVSIAARKDQSGAEVSPELKGAFDRRETELRARRAGPRGQRRRGSAPPLDRAAGDR